MRYIRAVYIVLLALSIGLLLVAVASMSTEPPSWISFQVSPLLMPLFFGITLLVFLMILGSNLTRAEKLSLVFIQSFLNRIISAIVLFPGVSGDGWYHLGRARTLSVLGIPYELAPPYVHAETANVISGAWVLHRGSAQYALTLILSKSLSIDLYWVHISLLASLWSFLVPLVAFKISKTLGLGDDVALLTGLLISNAPVLVVWSYVSVANSFGFLFFFAALYFFLRSLLPNANRRSIVLAFIAALTLPFFHDLPALVAFSIIVLGLGIRKYVSLRESRQRIGVLVLSFGFITSIMLLPVISLLLPLIYPSPASFSLDKIFTFDAYSIIFAEYADYTFIAGLTDGILLLLGAIGMILVLYRRQKSQRFLSLLVISAFIVLFIQYRFYYYFSEEVLFGIRRLPAFWLFLITPFAAIGITYLLTISRSPAYQPKIPMRNPGIKKIGFGHRQIIAVFLVSIGLSALFVQSTLSAWTYLSSFGPRSIVSPYSQEAARLIHQEYLKTNERYVVVSDSITEEAGVALVGLTNYNELYLVLDINHQLFTDVIREVSPVPLMSAAAINNASLVYFIMVDWSIDEPQDFDTLKSQLSRRLELYASFADGREGQLAVFRFRAPQELLSGSGPRVKISKDLQQIELNTTYSYKTIDEVTYSLVLQGGSTYNITDWPQYWSFEGILPNPNSSSIDANAYIAFTGLPNAAYNVTWLANELYRKVVWKDDSFVGWQGRGYGSFSFTTDGDILTYQQTGSPSLYSVYWKEFQALNGTLTLVTRFRGSSSAGFAISLWTGVWLKEAWFSGWKIPSESFETYVFSVPENLGYDAVSIWLETLDGTPAALFLDYVMIVSS